MIMLPNRVALRVIHGMIGLIGASLLSLSLRDDADAQQYFNGYPCTQDCSGHEAGYDWAVQNAITNPSDCSGNSQSFVEGCESYTEEYQATPEDDGSDDMGSSDDGDTEQDQE